MNDKHWVLCQHQLDEAIRQYERLPIWAIVRRARASNMVRYWQERLWAAKLMTRNEELIDGE